MKKFIFIMPLMAVSLLVSCGSKLVDPSKIDLYKKEIGYDETGQNINYITEYTYNDKGLCIKEMQTKSNDPSYKQITECSYDEHENIINRYNATYNGEEIKSQHWDRYEYTYDKQNRVIKKVDTESRDNVDWKVFSSIEYEYKESVEIKKCYDGEGSLEYTATLTFDKKGDLVNEKTIYEPGSAYLDVNSEIVYTVDKNGCATKIERYTISSTGERFELTDVSEITYLNNLWYRPLKETSITYIMGEEYYSTSEREYDSKNRIKLYKIYYGTEEATPPEYISYYTYEY